jgi:hypothetical protein
VEPPEVEVGYLEEGVLTSFEGLDLMELEDFLEELGGYFL